MELPMRSISRLLIISSFLAVTLSAAFASLSDRRPAAGPDRFMIAVADTSSIHIDHVWARPTPGAATSGAAYFTVTNDGSPDQLVGVSTPIATTAGVHETTNDNGIMKMRPVAAVALDPGKPVMFKPGGYHVMLMGLKGALKVGDSFPLTLTFAHAEPVTVTVNVDAVSGMGTGGGGMPGMR
jgi:copper(I)-binding protein